MYQNNGLEAKTSKEEIRITIKMDLQQVFPQLFKFSLHDKTSQMETTIRTIEGHMINAQISHSIEAEGNPSRNESFNNQNRNWGNNGNFSHSPSTQKGDYSQSSSYRQ